MDVETNPLLPPENRPGGIEAPWAGDDQQWWDWYVTLAEPTEIGQLGPGPGSPKVAGASDEGVLAALDEPYALPAGALEAFAADTFVRLPAVLPPAVVVRLEERLGELLEAAHGGDTAGRFLALEQLWLSDPLMRAVALSRRLGDIAAALLGADAVRLYHDNALSKEPGCGRTPWHHDAEHFPFTPPRAVTAWLPVTAIPTEMGPLTFARGTHVQALLADLAFDKIGTSYDTAVAERLRQAQVSVRSEPYGIGDVSFHSAQCFHTAGPNRTVQPRRALATTYVVDGVRILDAPTMVSGTWREFVPGTEPGGLVASELNPVVGHSSIRRSDPSP